MRSPAGEKIALEYNFFIETLLPTAILRDLTDAEHADYRRPFLPIGGTPSASVEIIAAYGAYLSRSDALPKLFINAEPGAFLVGYARDFVRTWPNQEDSADEIGTAISQWLARLD